jgi:hypothetical protein
MAVVFLLGIVLMLALVVNIGFWYASQRRVQSVADSVSLAVASQIPGTCQNPSPQLAADCYANLNWGNFTNDGTVSVDAPGDGSVTVHVTHPVPGFFTSLIGEAFGTVTVGAHATAAAQAPATLDNSSLQSIAQTPTYVAPLVVSYQACSTPPWNLCLGASGATAVLDETNPTLGASNINVVDLACARTTSGCQNPGAATLANWITCGPCLDGELGINTYVPAVPTNVLDTCPGSGPRGRRRPRCVIRDALNTLVTSGQTVLAAVADSSVGNQYHVVGYAAMTITRLPNDRQWRDQPTKTFGVKFQGFTPEPTLDPSGSAPAYGLQTIGLTG